MKFTWHIFCSVQMFCVPTCMGKHSHPITSVGEACEHCACVMRYYLIRQPPHRTMKNCSTPPAIRVPQNTRTNSKQTVIKCCGRHYKFNERKCWSRIETLSRSSEKRPKDDFTTEDFQMIVMPLRRLRKNSVIGFSVYHLTKYIFCAPAWQHAVTVPTATAHAS